MEIGKAQTENRQGSNIGGHQNLWEIGKWQPSHAKLVV
jgi:hypothetical protein